MSGVAWTLLLVLLLLPLVPGAMKKRSMLLSHKVRAQTVLS
jgi:hypothetical protein